MGDFNCERRAGVMSVWFGCFPNREDFYRYIQTTYRAFDEDDFDPVYNLREADFQQELEDLFLCENALRAEEAYFKEIFTDHFNHFEYDFGVIFDEDFQICGNCEQPTLEVAKILDEWQQELERPMKALFPEGRTEAPYNCFVAIPSFKYIGDVKHIETPEGVLDYIGCFEESMLSNDLAEQYVLE